MMPTILLASVIPLYILVQDQPQNDRDRIQGAWSASAAEVDGVEIKQDSETWKSFKDVKLTFKGDRVNHPALKDEALFALDAKVMPHTLDLIILKDGKTKILALLYELDGDTLRLCLPINPDVTDRPKEFSSKKGHIVLTLKRMKE